MKVDYDILIVGGGMVGATLAVSLADSGYCVGVVEAYPFANANQPSYDDRSIALSYGSRRLLERFDLWDSLKTATEAIDSIHVSDRGHFGMTRIHAADELVDALGYVVENRSIGRVFLQRLTQSPVDYLCPAVLVSIDQNTAGVKVLVEIEGQRVSKHARLVVAADGAQSGVRDLLQIPTDVKDYHQSAVISNITPQCAHQNIAYERFTENGPLALLPMQDYCRQSRCSLVWTLPTEQADAVMLLQEADFLRRLQACFGHRLGRLLKAGKRSVYPLRLSSSQCSTAGRVLFIGNAKQALHPVAGQGFNLALRDVAELHRLLLGDGRLDDVGAAALLQCYAQQRRADRERIIRFTDGLITWFTHPFKPLGMVRGLSLLAMDLLPYARHRFARFSMGLSA